MKIKDYISENNLNRISLVGTNSQGKTYYLNQEFGKDKSAIFVQTEVKADENMKNSADSTTLIMWLNELLSLNEISDKIDDQINSIDFSSINDDNEINVNLGNDFKSFKGLISARIKTNSNSFGEPGSGERFLGQLYLISKILEDDRINKINKFKFLIIDEPEQHLHPSLFIKMAKVLNKLSQQGVTIVISTHSPIIVRYFNEDTNEIIRIVDGEAYPLQNKNSLLNLYKNFDVYTIEKYKFGEFKKIENNIDDYFNVFIMPLIYKCLFCNTVIIGEGVLETEMFEEFFEKHIEKPNISNVETIVLYGKCFYPWVIAILKTLNIKIISIFDIDGTTDEHQKMNETIKENSDQSLPLDKNIEEVLKLSTKKEDKIKVNIITVRQKFLTEDKDVYDFLDSILEMVNTDIVVEENEEKLQPA